MRSWAEGLDLVAAAHRYLGPGAGTTQREVRRTLQALLEPLRQLARGQGRPDLAALLRRDPEAMADDHAGPLPTLEAFAAEQPADFYSEAELVALYRERHGSADARSSARRRQRLRQRLVSAVQWAERQAPRPPQPDDLLTQWLAPGLAARLADDGIQTVGHLHDRIVHGGRRWYRSIRRLGPQGAKALADWLTGALPSGGGPEPGGTAPSPGTSQPLLRPLEQQVPPQALRGEDGINRAPKERCRIVAGTDLEAVAAWLARREAGSASWRSYRKEAERLLLWATLERGRALSSLDADDCRAYASFLGHPSAGWIAPRQTSRLSPSWRPFEGPLSARSREAAIAVLRALFGWLVRQRYLLLNSWDEVTPERPTERSAPPTTLGAEDGRLLERWLAAQPAALGEAACTRVQLLLQLAGQASMRPAELLAARLGDLSPAGAQWQLLVRSRRPRWEQLGTGTVETLERWLVLRGLTFDDRLQRPEVPLISRLDGHTGLTPGRLGEICRRALNLCAAEVEARDGAAARRLRQASVRWLRAWACAASDRS